MGTRCLQIRLVPHAQASRRQTWQEAIGANSADAGPNWIEQRDSRRWRRQMLD
jgi:hypothetical protein